MCYLDAEARLLVVLDDGAHEGAVPLEVLEHHLAEHLAVGARAWAGANHDGVCSQPGADSAGAPTHSPCTGKCYVKHMHTSGEAPTDGRRGVTSRGRSLFNHLWQLRKKKAPLHTLCHRRARHLSLPKDLDPMIEAVIIIGACVVLATTKSKQGRSCT